jgi:hypothetical protein
MSQLSFDERFSLCGGRVARPGEARLTRTLKAAKLKLSQAASRRSTIRPGGSWTRPWSGSSPPAAGSPSTTSC